MARIGFFLRRESQWLRSQALARMKQARKEHPEPWADRFRRHAEPKRATLVAGILLLALFSGISWLLGRWDPWVAILSGPGVESAVQTMWQVQVAIAALALPILVFAIERADSTQPTAARAPEVLVRASWIFPILTFALLGTARVGYDLLWFSRPILLATDFVLILVPTIVFTLFAFLRVLRLILTPSLLRDYSLRLVRSRMDRSLDRSILIRIANNILFRKLRDLRIDNWLFGDNLQRVPSLVALRLHDDGILADIHLGKLEQFVRRLPWKTDFIATLQQPTASPGPAPAANSDEQEEDRGIWFMKRYGDPVNATSAGLILLDPAKFETLGLPSLERQLRTFTRVSAEV